MIHTSFTLERATTDGTDVLDLTEELQRGVAATGVERGLCVVHVAGSTASITTIEFESGAVSDLKAALERLVPRDASYRHDLRWGDGNGYSHVRAALMGPSRTFPVEEGRLSIGTWQQVVLIDFDNRPRRREVVVHVQGIPR